MQWLEGSCYKRKSFKKRYRTTVDPLDPKAIAQAIEYLLTHPEEARQMGENGRRAVEEKYNWEKEAEKLLALYKELVDSAKDG